MKEELRILVDLDTELVRSPDGRVSLTSTFESEPGNKVCASLFISEPDEDPVRAIERLAKRAERFARVLRRERDGKTHLGESPLNKAEAHRLAHKLRDPKFYTARTKGGAL